MEKLQPGGNSNRNSHAPRFIAAALGLLMTLFLSGTAFAQDIAVSGTVTSASGAPLQGVSVRVDGRDERSITNANGRYSITAPSNGLLRFTLIGQRAAEAQVNGRATVDVRMEPIAFLEEVVVTAYTEQRRADITGAVGSVNIESADRQTSASVLKRLDAAVPGVTVNTSGSPGSRSTVRIRGISSFQNNDPLYVVDGTPMQDSYINWLNPNDITSIQVLKDASAASIYGSRASNGVIIIETTRKGQVGPPRATLRVRTGIAAPVRGYDDFLITNALDYHEIIKRSYENAGLPVPTNIYGDPNNPTVPAFIYAGAGTVTATDAFGRPTAVNSSAYAFPGTLIMPGSQGTNWWDAVFSPAMVGDYNLDITGGGDDNAYGVSFNYFDQEGTAVFNRFKRGSIRANTSFTRNRFTFGENIAVAVERAKGGLDDPGGFAEDGILGKNILMQPVIPVYDIQGNYASGKSTGLGNQSNPVKFADARQNNITGTNRIVGSIFGGMSATDDIQLRTQLGFNLGEQLFNGFTPITPENSEPNNVNGINEFQWRSTDWTWSNTARFSRRMSDHNISVLVGQEANENTFRRIDGSMGALISTDLAGRYIQDALGNAGSKNVTSSGSQSTLLSFFGKADYNFADKYVASVTLRQDGSSRLGPSHRWGTFPAVGLGWRITQEPFMSGNSLFSDVLLRFGWGITGNQGIPAGRIVSQFGGGRGDTFYDVAGSNTSIVAGYRQTSLGNADLKWEENKSINVGADVGMMQGKVNIVLDIYQRETENLLFPVPQPATAGIAAPPIVNIGAMENNGFDFSVGYRAPAWTATFNASRYKNKIVRIDGVQDFFYGPISTRYGNQVINQVGSPIGSFYGLVADGMFRDAADVAAHASQDGAAPGRIKFRDVDGDGQVTLADRTIIGSPHPDFTAGLDLTYRRGNFDVSGTLFGTFGNEIFDVQKEFYVFRNFSTNVRSDLLTDSWTPENPDAKYPRLDQNDTFSHAISSFYVEDGSYVRLRSLQLGYNLPPRFANLLSAARVYLQVENLLTFTGYDGLDPALPAANIGGPGGDIRDQYRGIDRGSYPSNRTFSLGVVTSF